jgi:hypothetical protein
MTELGYMVREDWAQQGTAMRSSSNRILEWLGREPDVFAVTDVSKLNERDRNADLEVARYLSPSVNSSRARNFRELRGLGRDGHAAHLGVVAAIHPYGERDCEALRHVVGADSLDRLFVMIWSPRDVVRAWLDGVGAVDLHVGATGPACDPLLVHAAAMMVNEEYNGLSSGRGKDSVVSLLRAFAKAGYPLDETLWLRAYFAAGGSFRQAGSISKFVREMKSGVKHRTRSIYRDDIVSILRKDVTG